MNILLVSDVYFPRVNGVSRSIQILRQALHELGHTTVLVAPDYKNHKGLLYDTVDKILRVPARKIPFDPEDRYMGSSYLKKAFQYVSSMKYQFDIIHIHTPFQAHAAGVKWGKKLGIPVVETYHTYFEEYFHCYIPFLPKYVLAAAARFITRHQCSQLDNLVVPSTPIRDVIRSYGIETPISIIPTGMINDDFFRGNPQSFKQYFDIDPERPLLSYVGRIAHEKNIEFLLLVVRKLAEIHPDILLVITGEGPAKKKLINRVAELKINRYVKFIGYLSRNKMLRNCYAASDIFVFASRTETQGLVLLEAMAQGIPVVSTAMLGTKDVLKNGQGCLVAAENTDDFVRKISHLLKNPQERRKLGEKGRAYASTYSSEAMAESIVTFYQLTINNYTLIQTNEPVYESR